MPADEKKNITINKTDTGFPDYLDFDKLRSEGIAYLGKLSGKIWTDHNVHDPGITILEELCYAVLDLGYRANLPVEDIVARDPDDKTPDNNFFTPAEILTCNPLTVSDYRKLLIDIPGIKNAWLKPATDITDKCRKEKEPPKTKDPKTLDLAADEIAKTKKTTTIVQTPPAEVLNGLYHVYLETEKDLTNDKTEQNKLLKRVTDSLMSHRNLCEDFEDIFILCKFDVGVCVSIEIDDNADAENVYLSIANKLREFFSPAPVFYTLQQLLEKGKTMEEIFSGRPYSTESHGFVDTDELQKIKLRKEIHVSDVYNVIFEIPGVRKISKLKVRGCPEYDRPDEKHPHWKFHIPENHVPSFSIACSGFEFTRNGRLVTIDTSKFETLLELGFTHSNKVLYGLSSGYLDNEIPRGIFHNDLNSYSSIQNDFPDVYGIGDGGLPATASASRQARALQLKAYLFFFDQLLTNYLSQLKNIRQLFRLRGTPDVNERHTYFTNALDSVPQMEKLIRFGEANNSMGSPGSALVYPVSKKIWEETKTERLIAEDVFQQQTIFTFPDLSSMETITNGLRDELVNNEEIAISTFRTADDKWLYTISSSAEKWILLSKKPLRSKEEAIQQAESVKYLAVFENNYRTFITADDSYTFNIEMNLFSYTDYLGMLMEDEELYKKRRKGFLSHLLSRFAERFTNFSLLNWNAGHENKAIESIENYLSRYDDISRNRGRAYNYLANGWGNDNISGFERKIKSLAGIAAMKKNYVCPFVVELYDEQYVLDFGYRSGLANFQFHKKFDLMEDAVKTAGNAIEAMRDPGSYQLKYNNETNKFKLLLDFGEESPAVHADEFSDSNEANELVAYLTNSHAQHLHEKDIVENSRSWKIKLRDHEGNAITTSADTWHSEEKVIEGVEHLANDINNKSIWADSNENNTANYYYDKNKEGTTRFIDLSSFTIDADDNVLDKPGRFDYEILDKLTHSFILKPVNDFENKEEAMAHSYITLAASADKENVRIAHDPESNRYILQVWIGEKLEAINTNQYKTPSQAESGKAKFVATVRKFSYSLEPISKIETWKFRVRVGYKHNSTHWFYSNEIFKSQNYAADAGKKFLEKMRSLDVSEGNGTIEIFDKGDKTVPVVTYQSRSEKNEATTDSIKKELKERKQLADLAKAVTEERHREYVRVDGVGEFGSFVYKLVKKNDVPAVFTESFEYDNTAKKARKAIAARSKEALRSIPEICLGGNIFREVKDNENNACFRYQVKFHHFDGYNKDELVLFESTDVFQSIADANEAFLENYLLILKKASDKEEYGKSISKIPVPVKDKEDYTPSASIAYITPEALDFLEDSWGAAWPAILAEYIKTYPVKIIDADSKEFAALFCKEWVEQKVDCSGKKTNWAYYFSLPVQWASEANNGTEWRSTASYGTATEAMTGFRYFSRLLKYTGNYFADCGCTQIYDQTKDEVTPTAYTHKIFVREVLAQSLNWFKPADYVWESKGVEKFIAAMQAGNAIKHYQQPKGCYSSYYTCGNGSFMHPCKYDTAKRRDQAMENLFTHWGQRDEKAYAWSADGKGIILYDSHGQPFAQSFTKRSSTKDLCDFFIHLAEQLFSDNLVIKYDKKGHLIWTFRIDDEDLEFQSVEQKSNQQEADLDKWMLTWRKSLNNWACYFPLTRTKTDGTNGGEKYKYCVEIKLPGFSSCEEDSDLNTPCICKEDKPVAEPNCHIAWKSNCCFASCSAALQAYESAAEILRNKKNYYASFDCECNSFGINLHTADRSLVTPQSDEAKSDIIAFNPQCYDTPDEVCEAACIAEQLVNSEGLHLAEHILLRPRREGDCDCKCRKYIANCKHDCEFPAYPSHDTDPCSETPSEIYFSPGADPYSFIATIILPIWAYRLSQENDRQAIEKLIYQEAPAHVLVRILWLRPHDFCTIESTFRNWNRWLAGKKSCGDSFDPCKMIELLFCKAYKCPVENKECQPCEEPGGKTRLPCFEKEQGGIKPMLQPADKFKFLNQVNDLFCMERLCDDKRKPRTGIPEDTQDRPTTLLEEARKNAPAAVLDEPKTNTTDSSDEITAELSTGKAATATQKGTEEKSKKRNRDSIIRQRQQRNKAEADKVANETAGNQLAGRVKSFLLTAIPTSELLDKIADAIVENAKPTAKAATQLTAAQQATLLQAAICGYLDKICFNGKDEGMIHALQPIAEELAAAKIDMLAIYNHWDAAEVISIEPHADIDFVYYVLTGKKK